MRVVVTLEMDLTAEKIERIAPDREAVLFGEPVLVDLAVSRADRLDTLISVEGATVTRLAIYDGTAVYF